MLRRFMGVAGRYMRGTNLAVGEVLATVPESSPTTLHRATAEHALVMPYETGHWLSMAANYA
jgi:hypothetical protein